jgi:hypothetical protein
VAQALVNGLRCRHFNFRQIKRRGTNDSLQRPRSQFLLAAIFLAAALRGQQANPPPVASLKLPPPSASLPFSNAETLTYQVDWRLLPAGTLTMHVESAGEQEHISATAASLGSISLLYRVNDRFDSVFDRATGCSQTLTKRAEEGRRRVNTEVKFDYAADRQTLAEKNLVKGTSKQASGPLPGCATDVLSSVFYIASQPLVPGQSFTFPLADSLHTIGVTLKAEARETLKIGGTSYNTIRVQPTADAEVVRDRGKIWIWYTDDARHIPVQIKAKLFWGTLTFRLTSVESK